MTASSALLTPQQLIETALAASGTDGCVVVVTTRTTANIRWANNTVTTSGTTREWGWFVVAIAGRSAGTAASTSTDPADIVSVLRAAEQAARDAGPAEDAMELVGGRAADAFEMPSAESDFSVYDRLIPSLATAFASAKTDQQILYGFARHELDTVYLGTSTGVRQRWVQPTGTFELNAKSADLSRSAWAGQSTDDFADVDAAVVGASLTERLDWARRTVELPAGRYDTVLPPSSVADLMIYLAWTASGRAAHEGRSAFSAPGGGTRLGERLGTLPLSLYSDPAAYPIESAPFVVTAASSDETSVFDNGAPIDRTTLLDRGIISGLIHTRSSAARFGEPFAPAADNLVLAGGDERRSVADLVADVDRGLLLTSLWYIRSVDPTTLLLTGLTRDGVFLIEGGEITAAVNNYRFNMSPLDVLRQATAASRVERSLSREWSDWFTRTLTTGLRVADFNMSSISQAQ